MSALTKEDLERSLDSSMAGTNPPPKRAPAAPPEAFVIGLDLASQILNYLASKPFNEVVVLIQGLQQLEPAVQDKPSTAVGDRGQL